MRDEDLERIEQGDPTSPVEVIIGLGFLLGIVGLIAFILGGVL